MPVETLKSQSITPQDGMEKPVNPPAQRVTVATSSKFADNDDLKNRLVLLVDGNSEVLVDKHGTYLARDVSFAIFGITGVREPYAIRSFITEKRKDSVIQTTKAKKGNGSLGYGFDQETFVWLINAVLPEMELYKPVLEDLLLPNGAIVPKSKSGLEDNFLHCILEEATKRPMKRSKLAAKFRGGKSPKKALIRCNTLLNDTRERLRSFDYNIVNTVSHRKAIKLRKEPEYILKRISKKQKKVKSKASFPNLPPPNERLSPDEQKLLPRVIGQLALMSTDTILSHMQSKATQDLGQIDPNLKNFLSQCFSKPSLSRINFLDIIPHQNNQEKKSKKQREKEDQIALAIIFISFFREILENASAAQESQLTSGREASIATNYKELKKQGYTVEVIIQKVCKHFHIKYEEPSKPATSSPAQ